MTPLQTELTTDPLSLGYAPHVAARDDGVLAALLNTPRGTRVISKFCTALTILSKYPDGPLAADALMTSLEAFAAKTEELSSVTRRALSFVQSAAGIDLGDASTIAMLGALAQAGVLTADQLAKLMAIATETSSRALDVLGVPVSVQDVSAALNGAS